MWNLLDDDDETFPSDARKRARHTRCGGGGLAVAGGSESRRAPNGRVLRVLE